MSDLMSQVKLTFFSSEKLLDVKIWSVFLLEIEQYFGTRLSHLDDRDPIRRKVATTLEAGEFVCNFGEREDSRRLHGKFERKFGRDRIEIDISLFRGGSRFPCQVQIYVPGEILSDGLGEQSIENVFLSGIKHLRPFYAYSDLVGQEFAKRKATGFPVNIEAELTGLFWLTFLNSRYVEYLGRGKLEQLPEFQSGIPVDGALLKFGMLPGLKESIDARAAAQELLGSEHFVDPRLTYDKLPGRHALRLEELRS